MARTSESVDKVPEWGHSNEGHEHQKEFNFPEMLFYTGIALYAAKNMTIQMKAIEWHLFTLILNLELKRMYNDQDAFF